MAYGDKTKKILAPLLGLNTSTPSTLIEDRESPNCLNVSLSSTDVHTRNNFEELLEASNRIEGLYQFVMYSGTSHLIIATSESLYKLESDGGLTDIYGGSTTWNVPNSILDYCFFVNKVFITNNSNPIQVWDGEESTTSDVDNSEDYRAKCIRSYANRLIMLNVTESGNENPQRVRWTALGTYDDFTASSAGFVDLLDSPGSIITAKTLSGNLIIYKDDSLIACNHTGGNSVFSFETLISGVGAVSPRAVVVDSDRHIFLGLDDVYEYSGGRSVKPLGSKIVEDMPRGVNLSKLRQSFATKVGNEIWFFVPVGSNTVDTLYAYNTIRNSWTKHELQNMTCSGLYTDYNYIRIGDLRGTIGGLEGVIADYRGTNLKPTIIIGTKEGKVYKYSRTPGGQNFRSYWESKDFTLGEDYSYNWNRYREIEVEAKGTAELEVLYSDDLGETWHSIGSKKLKDRFDSYHYYLNISTKKIRLRFIAHEGEFHLREFGIHFREGGYR